MEHFTPVSSLIGGILIGLSGSALLLFNGRIAGISGILGGLVNAKNHDALWRVAFVAGLLTGGLILRIVNPDAFQFGINRSAVALLIAGFMVGLGSRIANGCTSGHGVCGISRLSRRSILATTIFIIIGAASVYVINHFLGGSV
jgi:uncharacterized membrane protein YedE/YeeE